MLSVHVLAGFSLGTVVDGSGNYKDTQERTKTIVYKIANDELHIAILTCAKTRPSDVFSVGS